MLAVQVVPVQIVWNRAPRSTRRLARFFAGADDHPSLIRRLWHLARGAEAILSVVEAIDLATLQGRVGRERIPKVLRRIATRTLYREAKLIRGPVLLSHRAMKRRVLQTPPIRELAVSVAAAEGVRPEAITRRLSREYDSDRRELLLDRDPAAAHRPPAPVDPGVQRRRRAPHRPRAHPPGHAGRHPHPHPVPQVPLRLPAAVVGAVRPRSDRPPRGGGDEPRGVAAVDRAPRGRGLLHQALLLGAAAVPTPVLPLPAGADAAGVPHRVLHRGGPDPIGQAAASPHRGAGHGAGRRRGATPGARGHDPADGLRLRAGRRRGGVRPRAPRPEQAPREPRPAGAGQLGAAPPLRPGVPAGRHPHPVRPPGGRQRRPSGVVRSFPRGEQGRPVRPRQPDRPPDRDGGGAAAHLDRGPGAAGAPPPRHPPRRAGRADHAAVHPADPARSPHRRLPRPVRPSDHLGPRPVPPPGVGRGVGAPRRADLVGGPRGATHPRLPQEPGAALSRPRRPGGGGPEGEPLSGAARSAGRSVRLPPGAVAPRVRLGSGSERGRAPGPGARRPRAARGHPPRRSGGGDQGRSPADRRDLRAVPTAPRGVLRRAAIVGSAAARGPEPEGERPARSGPGPIHPRGRCDLPRRRIHGPAPRRCRWRPCATPWRC